MTLGTILGIIGGVIACVAIVIVGTALLIREFPSSKLPSIPLNSRCPACGNGDCSLAYDAEKKHVERTCRVCGCKVTQPPVAPHLFRKQ